MSKTAHLPDSYVAARNALRDCHRHFTPEGYTLAAMALARCWETDEPASWPQDADTLNTYFRMANDNELMRLAGRVEKQRAAWRSRQTEEQS